MKKGKYENLGKIRGNSDPKPEDQKAELNPTWGFGQDIENISSNGLYEFTKRKEKKKVQKKKPRRREETEETEFREAHNAVSLDSPLTSSPS
jgi:hypothetical protein